jgi:hypothetical protein
VLYISGYSDRGHADDPVPPSSVLLQKPFPAAELVERVGELLDGRPR